MMGYSEQLEPSSGALPVGTRLKQEYTIQKILGSGGFGITYGGVRIETGEFVAVKEYFPKRLAFRTWEQGNLSLQLFSDRSRGEFEEGRRHFLDEAKILRKLEGLDSIVSVYDYFEENGTAYIVMEYIKGSTLGQIVKEKGTLSFEEMTTLFSTLLVSVGDMHQWGLVHRDISPENLILGEDSRLHLIDFGAAKWNPQEGEANTVILKAGYAPVELYIPNGKIGPWTDIYSICATMYFTLTGLPPEEAVRRMEQGEDEILPGLGGLAAGQSAILKKGLALQPAHRFASAMKLREALMLSAVPGEENTVMGAEISGERAKKIQKMHWRQSGRQRYRISVMIMILGIMLILLLLWRYLPSLPYMPGQKQAAVSWQTDLPVSPSPASTQRREAAEDAAAFQENVPLSMVSVKNMKLKKARSILKKLDPAIKVETVYVYHQRIAAGRIIRQSVASGTLFTRGNLPAVLLTVSKGKEKAASTPLPFPTSSPDAAAGKAPVPAASQEKENKSGDYDVEPEDGYTDFSLE